MARCFVLLPCISHIIFRQIWQFEMRRKISCLKKTGEKLENDECESIEVEHNRWLYHLPSFPPSVPHLQSCSGKAAWGVGGGGGPEAANNKSRVSIIFVSEYVTRRLCIKKMPGRAGHESNPGSRFFGYICSKSPSLQHAARVACIHDYQSVHVYAHTRFAAPNLSFSRKLEKASPLRSSQPRLPFSLPAVLPLNSHAYPPPVIPRDFSENYMSGNEAEICPRIEKRTLI